MTPQSLLLRCRRRLHPKSPVHHRFQHYPRFLPSGHVLHLRRDPSEANVRSGANVPNELNVRNEVSDQRDLIDGPIDPGNLHGANRLPRSTTNPRIPTSILSTIPPLLRRLRASRVPKIVIGPGEGAVAGGVDARAKESGDRRSLPIAPWVIQKPIRWISPISHGRRNRRVAVAT